MTITQAPNAINSEPTQERSLLKIDISTQNLLFRTARTANRFTDEPVTDDQVAALHDLVKWGPTLMNSQPLRLVVLRSDDSRRRLLDHLAEGNRAKSESAPLVVVLAVDTDFHETLPRVFPHRPEMRDAFPDATRRERVALDQGWLQAGYFIIGVRALGLAAGPMAGFDHDGVDADLLAGTSLRSFLVVNVGHPAENAWFDRLPRLGPDDAIVTL
jgi:3-hydroxypropanoate dehydrogenase